MKTVEAHGYYVPPDFRNQLPDFATRTYEQGDMAVRLKFPPATPELVEALSEHLKKNSVRSY